MRAGDVSTGCLLLSLALLSGIAGAKKPGSNIADPALGRRFKAFLSAKAFKCTWRSGSAFSFEKRGYEEMYPGIPGEEPSNVYVYDRIDRQAGTGRFVGNQGSTDVAVFDSGLWLNLVETFPDGLAMTSIFAGGQGEQFVAAHVRHTNTGSVPFIPSFTGMCEPGGK